MSLVIFIESGNVHVDVMFKQFFIYGHCSSV